MKNTFKSCIYLTKIYAPEIPSNITKVDYIDLYRTCSGYFTKDDWFINSMRKQVEDELKSGKIKPKGCT